MRKARTGEVIAKSHVLTLLKNIANPDDTNYKEPNYKQVQAKLELETQKFQNLVSKSIKTSDEFLIFNESILALKKAILYYIEASELPSTNKHCSAANDTKSSKTPEEVSNPILFGGNFQVA